MRLTESPKTGGSGIHRVISAAETWSRIRPVLPAIGVTRMAAIHGLDRIGIPVYSAIMPRSQDLVSVYNGKGVTPLDAKVGAAMEAIERFAGWTSRHPDVVGTYRELSRTRLTLHPRDLVIDLADDYADDVPIPWAEGFDLIRKSSILVPFAASAYYQDTGQYGAPCYALTSTNGLASGNTIEEAICHALCELIERDAITMAELLSRGLPKLLRSTYPELAAGQPGDDLDRFPTISLNSLEGIAAQLLDHYLAAGLRPVIRDVTSDNGIATIACTVTDDQHPDFSAAHTGIGTHPDAEIAVLRALTEAAQSRVCDIQGLREDISMATEAVPAAARHAQRVARIDPSGWYHRESGHPIRFADVASRRHGDIIEDIELMLGRLADTGLDRVIVVDLSPGLFPASVVRVLVPGLETWSALKGRTGIRAESAIRAAVNERRATAAANENARRLSDILGRLPGAQP